MRKKSEKTKIGVSSRQKGYKHIHLLNGFSFPKKRRPFFKYMPLDRFMSLADDGEIVFVSPETWYDPFEHMYYGLDYSSLGYKTEDIACLCVSEKSSTNEDACWKVYAGLHNKMVRISFDQDKLLNLLDDYAEKNGCEVYIGRANYDFKKEDIDGLCNSSSKHHKKFFPTNMRREHYLSLMLLKRNSYLYENEVRIFLVKEKIDFDNGLLRIQCGFFNQLISKIMLAPELPDRAKSEIESSEQNEINTLNSKQIKEKLRKMFSCQVQQSQLYKNCKKKELK